MGPAEGVRSFPNSGPMPPPHQADPTELPGLILNVPLLTEAFSGPLLQADPLTMSPSVIASYLFPSQLVAECVTTSSVLYLSVAPPPLDCKVLENNPVFTESAPSTMPSAHPAVGRSGDNENKGGKCRAIRKNQRKKKANKI